MFHIRKIAAGALVFATVGCLNVKDFEGYAGNYNLQSGTCPSQLQVVIDEKDNAVRALFSDAKTGNKSELDYDSSNIDQTKTQCQKDTTQIGIGIEIDFCQYDRMSVDGTKITEDSRQVTTTTTFGIKLVEDTGWTQTRQVEFDSSGILLTADSVCRYTKASKAD